MYVGPGIGVQLSLKGLLGGIPLPLSCVARLESRNAQNWCQQDAVVDNFISLAGDCYLLSRLK